MAYTRRIPRGVDVAWTGVDESAGRQQAEGQWWKSWS